CTYVVLILCFFFQAEDGIRDRNVTGVQTCALPIFYTATNDIKADTCIIFHQSSSLQNKLNVLHLAQITRIHHTELPRLLRILFRSEERRVGKERRSRWSTSR